MKQPYKENKVNNHIYRTFDKSDSNEFRWHKDQYDRTVEVTEDSDWKLQMDNELPVKLSKGTYDIPKEVYHRIIPGEENILKIKIKEYCDS
jgi:hypothetical protein